MPNRLRPHRLASARRRTGPSCRGGASSLLRQAQGPAPHWPAPARTTWRSGAPAGAVSGFGAVSTFGAVSEFGAFGAVEHVLSLPANLAAIADR